MVMTEIWFLWYVEHHDIHNISMYDLWLLYVCNIIFVSFYLQLKLKKKKKNSFLSVSMIILF